MRQKKGLIIGGDSNLGKALKLRLERDGWDIWTTTRRPQNLTNKSLFLDLLNPELSWCTERFDTVWFLAAQANQLFCKENPKESYIINVESPIQIMTILGKTGTHIIFPSTSLVFSGNKPFPTIDDPIEPVGEYAIHKSIVERFLNEVSFIKKTIIRFSKVLDKENGLLKQWVNSLLQGHTIHPLIDLNFSPISLTTATEVLARIGIHKSYGIMQISNQEQCSYVDFIYGLAKHLNLKIELIHSRTIMDLNLQDVFCPKYSTLDSRLVLSEIGINSPTIEQTISEI
jgi:dTDP-4-dehydrorhamnose reductase